jgi:hypothetical protein
VCSAAAHHSCGYSDVVALQTRVQYSTTTTATAGNTINSYQLCEVLHFMNTCTDTYTAAFQSRSDDTVLEL